MYAIVEFLRGKDKEYTVVPVIWLDNNNTVCYWPRAKTTEELEKLVKENSPYGKKWPKYKVHRVLKSSEDHDSLQLELNAILEESTTDSGSAVQAVIITDKPPREQEIDSECDASQKQSHRNKPIDKGTKRKHKSTKKSQNHKRSRSTKSQSYPKKKRQSSSSSQSSKSNDRDEENDTVGEDDVEPTDTDRSSKSENSPKPTGSLRDITNLNLTRPERRNDTVEENEDVPTNNNKPSKSKYSPRPSALFRSISNLYLTKSPSLSENISCAETSGKTNPAPIASTYSDREPSAEQLRQPPITSSTPRSNLHKFRGMSQEKFQLEVMTRLLMQETELSQINISLSQLARSVQFGNNQTAVRPDGFPTLPIETMADFRSFDALLKVEVHEIYFTNRLAAIGGTSLRQGVMNALEFALSNAVAMEFNWAGRDKKHPFQGTEMARIITAAVKIRFADSADATDMQISSAIKNWLKQAKHRLACQEKRNA